MATCPADRFNPELACNYLINSQQKSATVLKRKVGIVTTTIRSYVFVTDCYGAVAAMTSKDNEPNVEFTTASEVRRIAP